MLGGRGGTCLNHRARRTAGTLSPSRPPSGKACGAIAMQTKEIHPKTKLREEKSDLKKEERIGKLVMHEINQPCGSLYDAVWTPDTARVGLHAAFATSSPSCTAGGSTDARADKKDLKHLMKLVTLVKLVDDLCKCTRSTDAQLVSLRSQALSLLQVWTRALE